MKRGWHSAACARRWVCRATHGRGPGSTLAFASQALAQALSLALGPRALSPGGECRSHHPAGPLRTRPTPRSSAQCVARPAARLLLAAWSRSNGTAVGAGVHRPLLAAASENTHPRRIRRPCCPLNTVRPQQTRGRRGIALQSIAGCLVLRTNIVGPARLARRNPVSCRMGGVSALRAGQPFAGYTDVWAVQPGSRAPVRCAPCWTWSDKGATRPAERGQPRQHR